MYKAFKAELDNILKQRNSAHPDVIIEQLKKIATEMLITIQELEPVKIDPEFFDWQSRRFNPHSLNTDLQDVYKEKSDGTRAKVGLLYNREELALFKPDKLKTPEDNPSYIEGLNWSTYWFYLDENNQKVKFQPSNRINEIFEDPWSIYEFNALGYKTPNGTVVYYDSYL
jgi:hypothetical protein